MTMDFRTRSADVRREAAETLWRFRSRRAARRGATVPDLPPDAAAPAVRGALPVSPETAALIRAAREGSANGGLPDPGGPTADTDAADPGDDSPHAADPHAALQDDLETDNADTVVAVEPVVAADPDGIATDDPADAPDLAAPDPTGDDAVQAATGSSVLPDVPLSDAPLADAPAAQDVTDDDREPVVADAAAGPDPDTPSDPGRAAGALMDLPGVGAGLVWLLGRCGVHSLDDLARADAGRLEQDLGLVGQLLDLPSWIHLARQAVSAGPARDKAEGNLHHE